MKMKYYLRGFGVGLLFTTILFALIRKPESVTEDQLRKEAEKLGMVTAEEAEQKRLDAIRETELKFLDGTGISDPDGVDPDGKPTDGDGAAGGGSDAGDAGNAGGGSGVEDGGNAGGGSGAEGAGNAGDGGNADAGNGAGGGKEEIPEIGTENPEADGDIAKADGTDQDLTDPPGETGDGDGTASGARKVISIEVSPGMSSEGVCRALASAGLVSSAGEFNDYLISKGLQTSVQAGTHEIPPGADYSVIADIITGR